MFSLTAASSSLPIRLLMYRRWVISLPGQPLVADAPLNVEHQQPTVHLRIFKRHKNRPGMSGRLNHPDTSDD